MTLKYKSDCSTVVNDIKHNSLVANGAIVHEIIDHSRDFMAFNIVHEFRNLNFEAHNLAKHALTLGFGRYVWLGQPGELLFLPVNVLEI